MKLDRLLGITIYLLNHEKTSASTLAKRFEVSVRTIQRDIEALCMAGIPVAASMGADGGYEILDTFCMERQTAEQTDYQHIVAALQGLLSAYEEETAEDTLEKMKALAGTSAPEVILDFSVAREENDISGKLAIIRECMDQGKKLSFLYTNAEDREKQFEVEPAACIFQWYAWYLAAYYPEKESYCLFKLVRMRTLCCMEERMQRKHDAGEAVEILRSRPDTRKQLDIRLEGRKKVKVKCMEYLKGEIEEEKENGDFIMRLRVPENEHFWYGTILGLGNQIKVLEPESLKERICRDCREVLACYAEKQHALYKNRI